jgi:hypothetical protein
MSPCAFFTKKVTGVLYSVVIVFSNPFTICVIAGNAMGTNTPIVTGLTGVAAIDKVLIAVSAQIATFFNVRFIGFPQVDEILM